MSTSDKIGHFRQTFTPTIRFVTDSGLEEWIRDLETADLSNRLTVESIGQSRAGRELLALRIGSGPQHVSITAGAHADEPAGPITALCFAQWLCDTQTFQSELLRRFTFNICPQVNPDGGQVNSAWFSNPPDLQTYVSNVIRELPEHDVEFGYPGRGMGALRPENTAVAGFLGKHSPYVFHASLHSMGFASGAWFLIGAGQTESRPDLLTSLGRLASHNGFRPHDIERNGEKGFSRIAPGFCTTPSSQKMREFFTNKDDPTTAAWFRLNSMEYIQSLGGDPLVMVSELPVFALGNRWQPRSQEYVPEEWSPSTPPPSPGSTPYELFRMQLRTLQAIGDTKIPDIDALTQQFQIVPVPFEVQVRTQAEMLLAGLLSAVETP